MNESTMGYEWDVSWVPDDQQDMVYIDTGKAQVYLSMDDLKVMTKVLAGYIDED